MQDKLDIERSTGILILRLHRTGQNIIYEIKIKSKIESKGKTIFLAMFIGSRTKNLKISFLILFLIFSLPEFFKRERRKIDNLLHIRIRC